MTPPQEDDSHLRALYAATAADHPTTPHVDPDAIAAAVRRQGPEDQRLATLDHIATCASCRQDFELIRATHEAAAQLSRRGALTPPMRRRAVLAAAACVIAASSAVLLNHQSSSPNDTAPTASTERGAQDGSPSIATVATSPHAPLTWRAAGPDATYHVEILDDSGAVVFTRQTRDTTLPRPILAPGHAYLWWVRTVPAGDAPPARSTLRPLPTDAAR
jgi:hypothetical protein